MQDSELISAKFIEKYRKKIVPWGYNGLGYIVYKRTYAREMENGILEEWPDTIKRCINGAQKIGADYTKEEAERLFDYIFNLKCIFGGRMLWQLGTSTVERFGANSLLNCWSVQINELKAFEFIFENLMLGGGVGFSVRREDVHELPRVKPDVSVVHLSQKDTDFIVPDSREGWVKLLHHVLQAFFVTGKSFTYSTILIRGAGESIKGFGGKSSGPKILVEGIAQICKIIQSRESKKLRSVDVLDICNIIGSIVVSGNVRRSAQIALGDPDDVLFLRAKRWDLGNIPVWRSMSNNTIYADDYDHIMENVWDGYAGNGEPYGFFNLPLSRKFGRLIDGPLKECNIYPTNEDNCIGLNPCGEITLASYESCNLCELFLNNIQTKDELIDCAKLLYKTQKAINNLKFIHDETTKIVHKNMRIGLGVGGVCQSLEKIEWLDKCYLALRKFDKEWSKQKSLPESIKLTTVKPSGTVSLLAGATPGVHPAFDNYYIRRVRMSSNDALVETCRKLGFKTEYSLHQDGSINRDTMIIEFPCETVTGILTNDMSALKQLNLVKDIQTYWSDNAVSVTVYYKKEELGQIKEWLKENYKNSLKSVSFVLHQAHNFVQPPYESISKEKYYELTEKLKPIFPVEIGNGHSIDGLECSSGSCPIK